MAQVWVTHEVYRRTARSSETTHWCKLIRDINWNGPAASAAFVASLLANRSSHPCTTAGEDFINSEHSYMQIVWISDGAA